MAALTICSDFGAQEKKSLIVSIVSPSICHEVMGLNAMILIFWMLSFEPKNNNNLKQKTKRLDSGVLESWNSRSASYKLWEFK